MERIEKGQARSDRGVMIKFGAVFPRLTDGLDGENDVFKIQYLVS